MVTKNKKITKIPEEKAFQMIKRYTSLPKQFFCKNEKQLEEALKKLKFPLVLKATGKEILHKSEIKGVSIANSESEAKKEFKRLIKLKKCEKVLVQEFVKGIETILGIKYDETFGYVIAFGLGGVFVEVLKDFSMRICPISDQEAEEMLNEIKGKRVLEGFRGIKIDRKKLLKVLVSMSKFAINYKIKEMDINPLICNEKGCYAVDVRIFK